VLPECCPSEPLLGAPADRLKLALALVFRPDDPVPGGSETALAPELIRDGEALYSLDMG